jgi:chromosome segregation ATPase
MKENASLKRQIGGFKASNYRYKKQAKNDALYVKSLKNEVARIKDYVEEKDRVIAGLQSQITELNKRIANNQNIIQDLKGERDVAIANYDYVCGLPWYQRMFFKGK